MLMLKAHALAVEPSQVTTVGAQNLRLKQYRSTQISSRFSPLQPTLATLTI